MDPSRRGSENVVASVNRTCEQQPAIMSTYWTPLRHNRRSSIVAIFDDDCHHDDALIKQQRPSLHHLWVKYGISYVIGEGIFDQRNTLCELTLIICSWCLFLLFFPFSLLITLKIVQEYERAVIFRLGRLSTHSPCGPGMCFILPCIEKIHIVDMRTVSFGIPPQEILTLDSVTVAVDAVVYYRVFNPTVSVANVEQAHESTRLLAQSSLGNVLGTHLLSELLCDCDTVSNSIRKCLDEATDNWGIKVERVEIKDVRLPKMLQRIMATEAEAAREAQAKIIVSEGELKALVALKEAADILSQSPCAMQLRYLQTLSNIATEQNSTIIFPLPIDCISFFQKYPLNSNASVLKSFAASTETNKKHITTTDKLKSMPVSTNI